MALTFEKRTGSIVFLFIHVVQASRFAQSKYQIMICIPKFRVMAGTYNLPTLSKQDPYVLLQYHLILIKVMGFDPIIICIRDISKRYTYSYSYS